MTTATSGRDRVTVDGKFFRLGKRKFSVKGVTYGPFAPNEQNEPFPSPAQAAEDLQRVTELGANLLRVYYVPPRWFLDLAARCGIKLLVDIPWAKHLCFLDSAASQREARETVRKAVADCKGHPAVFAFSVANEIPADIVRWSGAAQVEAFLEELIEVAKTEDPGCLCTFTNFPPTEFLLPDNADFICFNVYLHERKAFEAYLARLQMIADAKPLLLAEFGMDSIREGEARKCEFLSWQIESAFRGGVAGVVVFSFTDDWHRGGVQIEDWAFGLTTRDRQPKYSFASVQRAFRVAPRFPLSRAPKVSVVVASYNGARTLQACLDSLGRLNYPNYEVILVDDGSTDDTMQIAKQFSAVRTIRHEKNRGLSVARNTGIAAAKGEIVAFTDSDCRADEDWLHYLVAALVDGNFAGVGGHNLLPPEDSPVAAAVMVSPGGPAHVMLSDREAEHIPGCNMAFYKWALEEIGGFDPVFTKAGDDVDLCWRLQERGHKIGFSSAGFVWHYRRSTVRAYLRQQAGYGEAEALLLRKHPEYFNQIGRSIWRGRIYAPGSLGVSGARAIIYHGVFGSGFFQRLYSPAPSAILMLCTSLEYHVLITGSLLVLSTAFQWLLPLAVASLLLSLGVCVAAGLQARLSRSKRRPWSRLLVALLFLLQPIERGFARYRARLAGQAQPLLPEGLSSETMREPGEEDEAPAYWTKGQVDRFDFLRVILARLEAANWGVRVDTGWTDHDIEVIGHRWCHLRITTVGEDLHQGRRLFRCRLDPRWSLESKLLFWTTAGAVMVIIGLFASVQAYLWLLPMVLPVLVWFLEHEQNLLRAAVAQMLNESATKLGLIKLTSQQAAAEDKKVS